MRFYTVNHFFLIKKLLEESNTGTRSCRADGRRLFDSADTKKGVSSAVSRRPSNGRRPTADDDSADTLVQYRVSANTAALCSVRAAGSIDLLLCAKVCGIRAKDSVGMVSH